MYSWVQKNTGLFREGTDHAPLVNYPKVMKTCARAKDSGLVLFERVPTQLYGWFRGTAVSVVCGGKVALNTHVISYLFIYSHIVPTAIVAGASRV